MKWKEESFLKKIPVDPKFQNFHSIETNLETRKIASNIQQKVNRHDYDQDLRDVEMQVRLTTWGCKS